MVHSQRLLSSKGLTLPSARQLTPVSLRLRAGSYRLQHQSWSRRRKAGEGFDRLAREMKVSRGTVVRAYDFANRDEAAAAVREGRKPTRPPYKWSDESTTARRKPGIG